MSLETEITWNCELNLKFPFKYGLVLDNDSNPYIHTDSTTVLCVTTAC